VPAKSVYLISPAYRRWLTPDFTDLEFELEGFDPKDATPWQADVLVRDLDSDAETRSVTSIEGTPKTFTIPAPKFHRRAEIVLYFQDRRTKEPACEGRWKLTNISKEELGSLSYFDSRGVFFHEGQGRFPLVLASAATGPEGWKAIAEAGFTGVAPDAKLIDDEAAKLAASLKLLLFPVLARLPPEAIVKEVGRLQGFSAVAGYCGLVKNDSPNVIRKADSSRPTIALSPFTVSGDDLHESFAEFQDVIMLNDDWTGKYRAGPASCRRSGRAHFAYVDVASANFLSSLYAAAAKGASGVLASSNEPFALNAIAGKLKESGPLVNTVVRGVPERSDDASADRWFWRRRLGPNEKAVIEVKRGDPPSATFTVTRE